MDDGFIPGFIIGASVVLAIAGFVASHTDDYWRDQIAKHGCAHYYLDANSQRQWDWIKP